MVWILFCLLGASSDARADIGSSVAAGSAGAFWLNVMALPAPVRVGDSAWSILVRERDSGALRTDVRVEIELLPVGAVPGRAPRPLPAQARTGRHPGFYSARVQLAKVGAWRGSVRVIPRGGPENGEAASGAAGSLDFSFEVGPRVNPWREHGGAIAFPFLALAVFGWHQRRRLVLSRRSLSR
jgi:hypothetical protein